MGSNWFRDFYCGICFGLDWWWFWLQKIIFMYSFFNATPDIGQIAETTNAFFSWDGINKTILIGLGLFFGFIILGLLMKILTKPNK